MPSSRSYDVIIVGMGPAGSSAALELSRAGLSVLGLEKQTHPRYKVCGGGLSARIERILPTGFNAIIEEAVHRLQFAYGPEDSYLVESANPIAYMVMRTRFDQWLLGNARQAGAEVHENEPAMHFSPMEEGIEVRTTKGIYHGRVVIGADGAKSLVAQQLFPGCRLPKIPALESEVPYQSQQKHAYKKTVLISLNAAKKGYGWIFPKKDGLSIGVGEFVRGMKRPRRSFQQFSREEPTLSALDIPAPVGHPIPIFHRVNGIDGRQWNGGLVRDRALLVGDAGHMVDPLLGEGIFYAVRSGQLAAMTIVEALRDARANFEGYEQAVIQEFGLEFQIASRLSRIIYGVPRCWHRWVGRTFPRPYQGVLRRYCAMLQGQETYQSLWGRIIEGLRQPFVRRS